MPPDQPEPASPARPGPRRPYRTPRYSTFVGTGAALGLAVGVALALYGGGDTVTSEAGVLGYFAIFGVVIGTLLGGTLAVVVESLMNRRSGERRKG